MKKEYIQALTSRGYQIDYPGQKYIFTKYSGDDCYVVMIVGDIKTVQTLIHLRYQIEAYYQSRGIRRVYHLTIVIQETAMFPEHLIHMTSEVPNLWLYAEDVRRMHQYENQPLEFDGLNAAFEQYAGSESEDTGIMSGRIQKLPVVTIILVALNAAMYFLPLLFGRYEQVIEWGKDQYYYVFQDGEYYRLFTSMFLHAGISHLVNNMMVLIMLGMNLEPTLGRLRYLAVYLLSGLGAAVCSCMINMDVSGSIGASGAIFGLTGAMLALVLFYRNLFPGITVRRVVYMCIASLYGGFTAVNVDNVAHIAGLVFGFFLVIFTNLFRKKSI